MEDSLILETTFLIDLERELASGSLGPAQAFLGSNEHQRLYTTFTVAGELAAGLSPEERDAWTGLLAPFHVLPWSPDVSWSYGQSYRYLRDNGLLIGANDLWIAATALAYEVPVVTRNEKHYRRVPGLTVRSYGPSDSD